MDFLTADISFKYARVIGFIAQLHIATLLLCSCVSRQQQTSLEMQFLFITCEMKVFLRVDTQ